MFQYCCKTDDDNSEFQHVLHYLPVELITNLLKADELDDEELSGKAHKDYCRIAGKVKWVACRME